MAALAALLFAGPAQAKLSPTDRVAINRTIDAFAATAVRRHDGARSYDLVTSQLSGGMTRAQWAKGDIPDYPDPARRTSSQRRWLDYAQRNEAAFELVPPP